MTTVYIRFAAHKLDDMRRSPLLERLLLSASRAVEVPDWRADAWNVLAPSGGAVPGVGATQLRAACPTSGVPWACICSPVHLSVGMSSVAMPMDGLIDLSEPEALRLAREFNAAFDGSGMQLSVGCAAVLIGEFAETLEVETRDPAQVLGHDVFASQPSGPAGPKLRRLMSEIEMWLFDHDINRGRAESRRPPITGLWLWGGGPVPSDPVRLDSWAAGRDPLFSVFGDAREWPSEPRSGVVVSHAQPGSEEWLDVERRWLAPAVEGLRSGRARRIDLSAAGQRRSVGKVSRLAQWRRPQPWWESYGLQ